MAPTPSASPRAAADSSDVLNRAAVELGDLDEGHPAALQDPGAGGGGLVEVAEDVEHGRMLAALPLLLGLLHGVGWGLLIGFRIGVYENSAIYH